MASSRVSSQKLVPAGLAREAVSATLGRSVPRARVLSDAAPLRPRGVGQILDSSLDVLIGRFGVFVGIAAVCWLPFQIGTELLLRAEVPQEVLVMWSSTNFAPQLLTTSFVCVLVATELLGRPSSVGLAIRTGFLRFPGIFVITFLNLLIAIPLMCLCILPVLFAYWLFSVTPAVYVLERDTLLPTRSRGPLGGLADWFAGIGRAIARGFRLVWGWAYFGRWLGWAVVSYFAVVTPLNGIPGLFQLPGVRDFLDRTLALRGDSIEFLLVVISAVFVGIGTAYTAVLMTMYFLDCRVRKEGLDLELRLDRLVSRGESGRA